MEQGWIYRGADRSSRPSTPAAAVVCVLQLLWFHGSMVNSILTKLHCRNGTRFHKFCHQSHKGGYIQSCRRDCCHSVRCSQSPPNNGATTEQKQVLKLLFTVFFYMSALCLFNVYGMQSMKALSRCRALRQRTCLHGAS